MALFATVNKNHTYSNSFYMVLNNDFYSNNKKFEKQNCPINCNNFYRICCYGFSGNSNPVFHYKNITLLFNGIIYNYEEISKRCPFNEEQKTENNIHTNNEETECESDNSLSISEDFDEPPTVQNLDNVEEPSKIYSDKKQLIDKHEDLCELIIHLYLQYGMEYTLQLLDGEFSIILMDDNLEEPETKLFVARDRLGKQPLYILSERTNVTQENRKNKVKKNLHKIIDNPIKTFAFATSLDFLSNDLNNIDNDKYTITVFPPGSYSKYSIPFKVLSSWYLDKEYIRYNNFNAINFVFKTSKFMIKTNLNNTLQHIQTTLSESIIKKIKMKYNHRENIACLLSGGVDSSIITALTCEYINNNNKYDKTHRTVETFCVGFKDSDDIRQARKVAEYLGTKHTEIFITEKEYIEAIPIVIQIIETYDTATVRAGVAQYLACEYIHKNTNHTEILTGDGADELMGGYLYMHSAPNMFEFDCECRNLLNKYHSNYGLHSKIYKFFNMEQNCPFLELEFINYYLSIPLEFRYSIWSHDFFKNLNDNDIKFKYTEKYLLRLAFSSDYFKNHNYASILPEEILWRTKEDFFDGISNYPNSLRNIINRNLSGYEPVKISKTHNNNLSITKEQEYYQEIFKYFFSGNDYENIATNIWRLKYVEPTNDPSAHTLDFYFDYNPEYCERAL